MEVGQYGWIRERKADSEDIQDQGMVEWQGRVVWMARLHMFLLQCSGNLPSLYTVFLTTLNESHDRPLHNSTGNPHLTSQPQKQL